MERDTIYEGREQTLVKHFVLRHYLQRFAHIVGAKWSSITYVDGFAGPWNVQSTDFEDSSFAIALRELRIAQKTHRQLGREIKLRCFFLEKDKEAYSRLRDFVQRAKGPDEVVVRNKSFDLSVGDILDFVRREEGETFPFIFIDPTGWTGFAMDTIALLLKLQPGEVLINFMTGHIRRFLAEEHSQQSFEKLFGSPHFKARVQELSGLELEDAAVSEYSESLKRVGGYKYVCTAMILHPEIDRTHFHLIYATRHTKGVEVFKETERKAMEVMESARAGAQKRSREAKSGQQELHFPTEEVVPASKHYSGLRSHYLDRARQGLLQQLSQRRKISYDEAWIEALSQPLVWESDLKSWIKTWHTEGALSVSGLQGRESVPKRGRGHLLVWNAH